MNRLWYEHAAHAGGFKGHDSFRFSLSDVDNETPAQSFFISVHTVQKGQRSRSSPTPRHTEALINLDRGISIAWRGECLWGRGLTEYCLKIMTF